MGYAFQLFTTAGTLFALIVVFMRLIVAQVRDGC